MPATGTAGGVASQMQMPPFSSGGGGGGVSSGATHGGMYNGARQSHPNMPGQGEGQYELRQSLHGLGKQGIEGQYEYLTLPIISRARL